MYLNHRAEAAVVFVKILGLEPKEPIGSSFVDVPDNFWAKREIEIAKQNGVFYGNKQGKFNPYQKITREQMAAVLNNVLNGNQSVQEVTPEEMPFSDVSTDHWSASAILYMYKQGIFSGHEDVTFGPTELLTRAQMAVLMNQLDKKGLLNQ